MKTLIILFGFSFSTYCINVFAQCDPNGIITFPGQAVNTELPSYENNTFFDWRDDFFPIYSTEFDPLVENVWSPFHPNAQNLNVVGLYENQDFLPEDGWELVSWDFGFDTDGNPKVSPAGIIHFILYNKYSSILRVFVAGQGDFDYNSATITMGTYLIENINNSYQPSLIQYPDNFTGLDKHYSGEMKSASRFLNSVSNWMYADFFINYDPCVCFYQSKMYFEVSYINTANVELTGVLSGQVVTANNKQASTVKNAKSFDINSAQTGYNTVKSFYEKGESAFELAQKIGEILSNNDTVIYLYDYFTNPNYGSYKFELPEDIFTEFHDDFHETEVYGCSNCNLLENGLQMVPYVGEALKIIKFFVDVSKKSATSNSPTSNPMTITGNLSLKGTITEEYNYIDIIKRTPGSSNSIANNSEYSIYNEVLGVFNIIETPKIKVYKNQTLDISNPLIYQYGLNQTGQDVFSASIEYSQVEKFELSTNSLKYTFNPTLGINDEDIEIMAALRFEIPTVGSLQDHIKVGIFETEMYSLNCLFNTSFTFGGTGHISFYHGSSSCNGNNCSLVKPSINNVIDQTYGSGFKLPYDLAGLYNLGIGQNIIYGNKNFSHNYNNYFQQYQRKYNVGLKLYITIKLPNGEKVLLVETFDLEPEIVTQMTKPEAHQQIKPFIRLDEAIELPSGLGNLVIEANNVVIASSANLGALGTSSLTIRAMNEIIVQPDAIINPNVILEVVPKQGCYALPVNVMLPESAVTTFCNSSAYKGIRNKNTLEIDEIPAIVEGNFTFNLFPNPTTDNTWMTYQISEESMVKIVITDLAGKIIEYSGEKVQSQGDYKVQLTTANLPKGFYLCALTVNGITQTKTLIIQ